MVRIVSLLALLGVARAECRGGRLASVDAALVAPSPSGWRGLQRRAMQSGRDEVSVGAECDKQLDSLAGSAEASHATVRVFMMSRCPFAAAALQEIVPAISQLRRGASAQRGVELALEFIGTGDDERSFRSLHGGQELVGDRLYLCLQATQPQSTFLRAVQCLSADSSRVGQLRWSEGCMGEAGISAKQQSEVFNCANEGDTASAPMLRESFAKSMDLKIGESPTVFFSLESRNTTTPAVRMQLAALGLEPDSELLYCGDRHRQGFAEGLCHALATLGRGDALPPAALHGGATECPLDEPDAEPECVDSAVQSGGAILAGPLVFLSFSMGIFLLHTCWTTWMRPRRRNPDGTIPLRSGRSEPVQVGLSAEQVGELPRTRVCDGGGTTCTICFEPVADGEDIFTLPCRAHPGLWAGLSSGVFLIVDWVCVSGHRHHAECLKGWLERKAECPDCRAAVGVVAPSRPTARGMPVRLFSTSDTQEQPVLAQSSLLFSCSLGVDDGRLRWLGCLSVGAVGAGRAACDAADPGPAGAAGAAGTRVGSTARGAGAGGCC